VYKDVMPESRPQADRRHSDRFPIEREVRYRVLNKQSGDETGDGKTINISSSGVLFASQQKLPPGRRMELFISWPAHLNDKCALQLVARGRVVRSDKGRAAIEIQQYEFRTQPAGPLGGSRLVVN
jgi:c-di-GMP-binding flagellar brake protein YcgR